MMRGAGGMLISDIKSPYLRATLYTFLLLVFVPVTLIIIAGIAWCLVALGVFLIAAGFGWTFWGLLFIPILYLVVLHFVKTA